MSDAKTRSAASQHTSEAQNAIELAYGLLWLAPTDRNTKTGELAYQARQVLLRQLDSEGRLRGLTAAQDMLAATFKNPNSPQISPHSNDSTH